MFKGIRTLVKMGWTGWTWFGVIGFVSSLTLFAGLNLIIEQFSILSDSVYVEFLARVMLVPIIISIVLMVAALLQLFIKLIKVVFVFVLAISENFIMETKNVGDNQCAQK